MTEATAPSKPKIGNTGWLIALLLLLPLLSAGYKVGMLGYSLSDALPDDEYTVAVRMSLDGRGERAKVRTFLPVEDSRQRVLSLTPESTASFRFAESGERDNRLASWVGTEVADGTKVGYTAVVRLLGQRFELGPDIEVPKEFGPSFTKYLSAEEAVQSDSAEVVAQMKRVQGDSGSARDRIRRMFDAAAALKFRPFSGTTDALTALRLGEASCNGKSRLLVAMMRAAGIPARLVGGVVLESGTKRTSHQWVEAYAGGRWVPFDPTNRHFAELPANYLVLYRGDETLFRHTSDTNFDYGFEITRRQVPAEQTLTTFPAFNVWALFARLGLPFSLLQTVLMLPFGALIVVLFRNVVGVPTFGTFLPALIAAAAGETGLVWGIVAVTVVMLGVVAIRAALNRFGLLMSPTLAILLAGVVVVMLGTAMAAERFGLQELTRIAYFPIAVMAIASERFYLIVAEGSTKKAFKHLAGTLLVVAACHLVMNSVAMQVLVSGFPEFLLWAVAANVYIGRWVGVRVVEYLRFRPVAEGQGGGHVAAI